MITNKQVSDPMLTDSGAFELTPAEIRGVLFEVARGQLDERAARPAIRALNRIMRAAHPPLTVAAQAPQLALKRG